MPQPLGQQPSAAPHAVTVLWVQTAVQVAALPVSVSTVQASASPQVVGQLAPSHSSVPSRTPSPQTACSSSASGAPPPASGVAVSSSSPALLPEAQPTRTRNIRYRMAAACRRGAGFTYQNPRART